MPTQTDVMSGPYKLAVCNQKGGVGKSTVTLNTAGALHAAGHDVLLIDLDPNGHLTEALGFGEIYRSDKSTLTNAIKNPMSSDIRDLIIEHKEFDLVPSSITLFGLQRALISIRQGELQLKKLLGDLDEYNVILIDCPPSLGLLTDNALLAAERLMIPVEADESSKHALNLLFDQIQALEMDFGVDIHEEMLVISNVNYSGGLNNEQERMINYYHDGFGEMMDVFEIRHRVGINRARQNGVSIFGDDEACDQEEAFMRIASAIGNNVATEHYV